MCSSFKAFTTEYYCTINCTVETFSTFKEFQSIINIANYKREIKFAKVIEIEGNAQSNVHFKYKSSFLAYSSVSSETNKLVLNTSVISQSTSNVYINRIFQNFQVLTCTFTRKYF